MTLCLVSVFCFSHICCWFCILSFCRARLGVYCLSVYFLLVVLCVVLFVSRVVALLFCCAVLRCLLMFVVYCRFDVALSCSVFCSSCFLFVFLVVLL